MWDLRAAAAALLGLALAAVGHPYAGLVLYAGSLGGLVVALIIQPRLPIVSARLTTLSTQLALGLLIAAVLWMSRIYRLREEPAFFALSSVYYISLILRLRERRVGSGTKQTTADGQPFRYWASVLLLLFVAGTLLGAGYAAVAGWMAADRLIDYGPER